MGFLALSTLQARNSYQEVLNHHPEQWSFPYTVHAREVAAALSL